MKTGSIGGILSTFGRHEQVVQRRMTGFGGIRIASGPLSEEGYTTCPNLSGMSACTDL